MHRRITVGMVKNRVGGGAVRGNVTEAHFGSSGLLEHVAFLANEDVVFQLRATSVKLIICSNFIYIWSFFYNSLPLYVTEIGFYVGSNYHTVYRCPTA